MLSRRRLPTRALFLAIVLVLRIASSFVATTHLYSRCHTATFPQKRFLAANESVGSDNSNHEEKPTSESAASSASDIVVTGIESTPNPSSFLIQLEKPLPGLEFLSGSLRGETYYSESSRKRNTNTGPPDALTSILRLETIDFVFAMPTVLTINKKAFGTWETLLPSVLESLLEESPSKQEQMAGLLRDFLVLGNEEGAPPTVAGQVTVRIQTAGGIPIQIEATGSRFGTVERRKLFQPKFQQAMNEVRDRNPSFDFFGGRVWTNKGVRYISREDGGDEDSDGEEESELDPLLASLLSSSLPSSEEKREKEDLDEVLLMESDEVDAAYPLQRLERIVAENCPGEGDLDTTTTQTAESQDSAVAVGLLLPPEKIDLAAVDAYCDASEAGDATALAALVSFVGSRKGPLPARRNALAFLGGTAGLMENNDNEDLIFAAVTGAFRSERSPAMRRTAGDALSDLGDDRAVPHAIDVLRQDRSKLVQWRAARILGELASSAEAASVLETLAATATDDGYAFEVAFEIRDALRKVRGRLNGGDNDNTIATGPMWKQIQEGTRK